MSESPWGCAGLNLFKKQRVVDFANNFGFSLCAVSSTCCIVTTSGKMKWSSRD